ncbi:hypothetical protein PHMEG_00028540 [Phytophthora megakarya]|uniref:Uncharacterized protein n=1 Tax=Phytophthora megakarya TaxID=4795 RepID=A0A225V5Q1_9STRA|nr:hypothetical protein PHMEG_00028540 [Phytophthora megakarya]
MLAFSPVEDEEDLSGQSQFDLIADILSRYDKPWSTVKFMVGDNCSVSQYVDRKEGAIPLIGCASHRFNLAVKDLLKTEEALIAKGQALMTKLRTLTAPAREATSNSIVKAAFKKRSVSWRSSADVAYVPPRSNECERFFSAMKLYNRKMWDVHTVEKLRARIVPSMKARLASDTSVVNNPAIESASDFKKTPVTRTPPQYMSLNWVPISLNERERFFIQVKLVLTELRKAMNPYTWKGWNFAGVVEKLMTKIFVDKLMRTQSFSALEKVDDLAKLDKYLVGVDDHLVPAFKFADDAKMRPHDIANELKKIPEADDVIAAKTVELYTNYLKGLDKELN